jgi:hypothetical protein
LVDGERDATGQPAAADLLRAALEKIVFFEWRISELAGELAAAHTRCANAEKGRAEAEEEARVAGRAAKAARMQSSELEAERARLSALLARPAQGAGDSAAMENERRRAVTLVAELEQARAELARSRAERERWVTEMIAQARSSDDDPALAQFISELRGEVIALRDYQKKCEALLADAGIAPPAFEGAQAAPLPEPRRTAEPLREARRMWAEGRLATPPPPLPLPALTTHFATPRPAGVSAAAQALADQCFRSLASPDPGRRQQAARHLVAAPIAAAAPAIASALAAEADAKTRAQLAKALAACGGDGAAEMVAQLQAASEPALVRLAALEALAAIPARARVALENAASDPTPAVRRRAAALAVALGVEDLAGRLAADEDATVRGAAAAARAEAPSPPPAQAPSPQASTPAQGAAQPRDPVRAALRRLVLEGGSR